MIHCFTYRIKCDKVLLVTEFIFWLLCWIHTDTLWYGCIITHMWSCKIHQKYIQVKKIHASQSKTSKYHGITIWFHRCSTATVRVCNGIFTPCHWIYCNWPLLGYPLCDLWAPQSRPLEGASHSLGNGWRLMEFIITTRESLTCHHNGQITALRSLLQSTLVCQ